MITPHRTAAVVLALCISTVPQAFAWSRSGHRTVAAIAYKRIKSTTREKVNAIIANDPRHRTFIGAAAWPDDIKEGINNENPQVRLNKPWHYVDIPYDANSAEITAALRHNGVSPNPHQDSSANVVTAIRYYTDFLRSGQGSAVQKADALAFLLHFVGDVHQPLHAVTVEQALPNYDPATDADGGRDTGGNGFILTGGVSGKAHSYWDNLLGSGTGSDQFARSKADELIGSGYAPGVWAMGVTDPARWAKESYGFRRFVYSPPRQSPESKRHVASNDYVLKAQKVGAQRATWAGYRLAALLDRIFAP